MSALTKDQILQKVYELGKIQPWNHNIELPFAVQTRAGEQSSHGKNLVKWERIKPLLEDLGLSGKRVLDVGCNEGFFSSKMAEMGAQVLGVDADDKRIQKANFVKDINQTKNVEFRSVNIYSQDFANLQEFDLCLCMGFLHRIPDPFTAIQRLTEKAKIILFEWKALKHGPHFEPYAYFSGGGFDKEDFYGTPFWLMSYACLESVLKRLGYDRFYRVDDPTQRRAILVAGRVDHPIFSKPQKIQSFSKFRIFVRHTKNYVKAILAIFNGTNNA